VDEAGSAALALAPLAAAALADARRREGGDVLLVLDELSAHAQVLQRVVQYGLTSFAFLCYISKHIFGSIPPPSTSGTIRFSDMFFFFFMF
jgi:hypothetical protein